MRLSRVRSKQLELACRVCQPNPLLQVLKPLKLLKVLDTKLITAELLIDTKIGKALTAVNDTPEASNDASLLDEVTKMKEHLKNKWKQVHAKYKQS